MKKNGFKSIVLILAFVFCFSFSFSYASAQTPEEQARFEQYLMWMTQNELGVAAFSVGTMLYVIENGYYQELTPGQKEALKKVLEETKASLASELDKHSAYHDAKQIKAIIEEGEKQFEGIGVTIGIPGVKKAYEKFETILKREIPRFNFDDPDQKFVKAAIEWITKTNPEAAELYRKISKGIIPAEGLLINEIMLGGGAETAGIKKGWFIKSVGGKPLEGMEMEKAIGLMKGPAGTEVELLLSPPTDDNTSQPYTIAVVRKSINVNRHYISYDMVAPKIGYLKIPDFYDGVNQDFKTAVIDLKSRGAERLIIDLRNNPGGLVHMATNILEVLLPAGRVEIYTKHRDDPPEYFVSSQKPKIFKGKIAILINGYSASASELVTISLKEHGVAIVIGETSYGKGSIQIVLPLPDDSALRLTIGRYYSPINGECVDGKGVTPDIQISDNLNTPQDEVVERAVEELSK